VTGVQTCALPIWRQRDLGEGRQRCQANGDYQYRRRHVDVEDGDDDEDNIDLVQTRRRIRRDDRWRQKDEGQLISELFVVLNNYYSRPIVY